MAAAAAPLNLLSAGEIVITLAAVIEGTGVVPALEKADHFVLVQLLFAVITTNPVEATRFDCGLYIKAKCLRLGLTEE